MISKFLQDYKNNQYLFANYSINTLYGTLPSYAYFTSNTELGIEYWGEFSNNESKIILDSINKNYNNDLFINSLISYYTFIPYRERLLKIVINII